MTERIAIIAGVRTPFCKSGGVFKDYRADDLGAFVVKELLERTEIPVDKIDEVIIGNVLQPPHATNIARVIAVKAGLPNHVPAFTVNRNCASGLESIVTGANKIRLGDVDIVIAGGTESMSEFPVLFRKEVREWIMAMQKARGWKERLKLLFAVRPSYMYPDIPGIADPLCGMTMGQTAEVLAREFHVTRKEQDAFALMSQERASQARKSGRFEEEIVPIPVPPQMNRMQLVDDGIREEQSMEILAKLKPHFDRITGSVTAANTSQVTDGAACVLLMRESKAKELGMEPLGYIREHAAAGVDPRRMGLGPVFAIAKVLDKAGMRLEDLQLIEINEAFAAQVIAVERALASQSFAQREMGRDQPVGELNREILNVNGGAIALGHPVGVSGTRLVLTLLLEMRRRGLDTGLVTMCIGGGQGEAAILEI